MCAKCRLSCACTCSFADVRRRIEEESLGAETYSFLVFTCSKCNHSLGDPEWVGE